ncbi:MAG: quinone-dependent dihydroorotate dehydrogenase [Alphaproteobacteria bacterium]|nr:quinone-dependent dihydroorotate dehydrogenase [Alphaproteobacteria bacterium]
MIYHICGRRRSLHVDHPSGIQGPEIGCGTNLPDIYALLRPALRRLPAEAARGLTLHALELGFGRFLVDRRSREPDPSILGQRLWGLHFPNPIGLAAGYDKDGRVPEAMRRLGFGFVEIGTVTPRPQRGNPKPRVFPLEEDQAIVNRMGFNNSGLDALVARLSQRPRTGIVGVNLGKNRDSSDAAADYVEGVRRAAKLADYLVVNVSSPNTPGLRDLQRRSALASLLRPLVEARDESGGRVPLLVKIAPDLTPAEREDVASVVLDARIDGLIVSNTTIDRPAGLVSANAKETGGLSGRPLFAASTALLAEMHRLIRGKMPLIGVGGVTDAADAYEKIRAGASLVQLYTALVFAGPHLVTRIKTGLASLLSADGFASVADAVGTGQDRTAAKPNRSANRASQANATT